MQLTNNKIKEEDLHKIFISSDDEYEVEEILNKRRNADNKIEYLVKWKSEHNLEPSWEPFSLVCKAYSKVFEYEFSLKAKDPNYKYDEEIYYLYEKIKFDKLNEKEGFSLRDPDKIENIFTINNNIVVKIKWKESSYGVNYPDTFLRLSDCFYLPKVMNLINKKMIRTAEYIGE